MTDATKETLGLETADDPILSTSLDHARIIYGPLSHTYLIEQLARRDAILAARAEAPPVHEGGFLLAGIKAQSFGYTVVNGRLTVGTDPGIGIDIARLEAFILTALAAPSRPVVGGEGSMASGVHAWPAADQAALTLRPWVRHLGCEQPVSDDTMVDVALDNGAVDVMKRADFWEWDPGLSSPRIVSYCVRSTSPAPASRTDPPQLDAEGMALEWLARNPACELSFGCVQEIEDCEWQVHRVNGGRNDREWTLIASGATPLEALAKAAQLDAEGERS